MPPAGTRTAGASSRAAWTWKIAVMTVFIAASSEWVCPAQTRKHAHSGHSWRVSAFGGPVRLSRKAGALPCAANSNWSSAMSEMKCAAGRPRLALVLGSGGVRSVAALGVAGVLAREGLAPELVVGCSSGALFGACIASGMTSEESLAAATKLWSAELTEKRRWRAYAELLLPGLMGSARTSPFAMRT